MFTTNDITLECESSSIEAVYGQCSVLIYVTHRKGSTMHRTEKGLQNTEIYIYNYATAL